MIHVDSATRAFKTQMFKEHTKLIDTYPSFIWIGHVVYCVSLDNGRARGGGSAGDGNNPGTEQHTVHYLISVVYTHWNTFKYPTGPTGRRKVLSSTGCDCQPSINTSIINPPSAVKCVNIEKARFTILNSNDNSHTLRTVIHWGHLHKIQQCFYLIMT